MQWESRVRLLVSRLLISNQGVLLRLESLVVDLVRRFTHQSCFVVIVRSETVEFPKILVLFYICSLDLGVAWVHLRPISSSCFEELIPFNLLGSVQRNRQTGLLHEGLKLATVKLLCWLQCQFV